MCMKTTSNRGSQKASSKSGSPQTFCAEVLCIASHLHPPCSCSPLHPQPTPNAPEFWCGARPRFLPMLSRRLLAAVPICGRKSRPHCGTGSGPAFRVYYTDRLRKCRWGSPDSGPESGPAFCVSSTRFRMFLVLSFPSMPHCFRGAGYIVCIAFCACRRQQCELGNGQQTGVCGYRSSRECV